VSGWTPGPVASAPASARAAWWAACGENRCRPSRSTQRGWGGAVGGTMSTAAAASPCLSTMDSKIISSQVEMCY
jgi:hypothetical protein